MFGEIYCTVVILRARSLYGLILVNRALQLGVIGHAANCRLDSARCGIISWNAVKAVAGRRPQSSTPRRRPDCSFAGLAGHAKNRHQSGTVLVQRDVERGGSGPGRSKQRRDMEMSRPFLEFASAYHTATGHFVLNVNSARPPAVAPLLVGAATIPGRHPLVERAGVDSPTETTSPPDQPKSRARRRRESGPQTTWSGYRQTCSPVLVVRG